MKRERGLLRTKANNAKQRLAMGSFDYNEPQHSFNTESIIEESSESVCEFDNELYTRISFLVASGVVNPLGHVLDKNKMQEMSLTEKERYVFSMSTKVREMTDRYLQNKDSQDVVAF